MKDLRIPHYGRLPVLVDTMPQSRPGCCDLARVWRCVVVVVGVLSDAVYVGRVGLLSPVAE